MAVKHSLASVHGRFQPPHLDHLEYIEAGLDRSEHLIIGITQPSISTLADCPEDPHRAESSSNPFTYEERCDLISRMLLARGISNSRFSFTPFPIESPDSLANYVDTSVPCLTTIRDQWNIIKIDRLRSLGYTVDVLWDRQGTIGIQGTLIRRKIQLQDQSWKVDVHPAIAEHLINSGLIKRLL